MAGDWIKMRESLHEDPAVLSMAHELGTRPEHVVGYCHKFWSWASRNMCRDSVANLSPECVDSVLNLPGFCELLEGVGWLETGATDDGKPFIRIPNYDRHLSQGAKARALKSEQKRKERREDVAKMSPSDGDKTATREEKRREDIKGDKSPLKTPLAAKEKFSRPTVEQVAAYCRERRNSVDAQSFVDFYESKGWLVGKSPMKDWQACVRTWEKSSGTSRGSPSSRIHHGPGQVFQGAGAANDEF